MSSGARSALPVNPTAAIRSGRSSSPSPKLANVSVFEPMTFFAKLASKASVAMTAPFACRFHSPARNSTPNGVNGYVATRLLHMFADHQIGQRLQAMSDWLVARAEGLDRVEAVLQPVSVKNCGRKRLLVESVLRCAILLTIGTRVTRNWSYS